MAMMVMVVMAVMVRVVVVLLLLVPEVHVASAHPSRRGHARDTRAALGQDIDTTVCSTYPRTWNVVSQAHVCAFEDERRRQRSSFPRGWAHDRSVVHCQNDAVWDGYICIVYSCLVVLWEWSACRECADIGVVAVVHKRKHAPTSTEQKITEYDGARSCPMCVREPRTTGHIRTHKSLGYDGL